MTQKTKEQLVIIGGGPAGMSAALYASRAGLAPLVFAGSPYGGQLMLTTEVENFPGISQIMGPELIESMRKQVTQFGAKILDKNVLSVDFKKRPLSVMYEGGAVEATAVIVALGAKALWLGLESETRLRGKGVSACATCDGFFFKNKVVGVVGGGDTAMEEALVLTNFASKVYLIHRREEFRASPIMLERVKAHEKIEVIMNAGVTEVLGAMKVEGIHLQATKKGAVVPENLAVDGLFIAIGHKPDTDLVRDQLHLDEKGYLYTKSTWAYEFLQGNITIDEDMLSKVQSDKNTYTTRTSVNGVFAAGDCVDHIYRQASTAAGMGVAAALDAQRYIESLSS